MFDLTMTAVRRADYLDEALSCVKKRLSHQPTNVFVNVDPVGPSSLEGIRNLIEGYYPGAVIRAPNEPSFPLAVKWLWQRAESPFLFHVEDSKFLNTDIDVKWILSAMDELSAVSLKFVNTECEVLGPPNLEKRSDGLFQTDYYDKAVTMQPTFWQTDVVSTLAGWMRDGVSPEKTIRPGKLNPAWHEVVNYMRQFKFGFVTDRDGEFWYERRGKRWRVSNGYIKKGKQGIPDTWAKIR